MRSQCRCDFATDRSKKKVSYITHNDWSVAESQRYRDLVVDPV